MKSLRSILWPPGEPSRSWTPETLEDVAHRMILYGFGPGPEPEPGPEAGWRVLSLIDNHWNAVGAWLVSPRGRVTLVFWSDDVGPERQVSPSRVLEEHQGSLQETEGWLLNLAQELDWVELARHHWPDWMHPPQTARRPQ